MPHLVADAIPDGTYATANPDQPNVVTLWVVRFGNLSAYPPGRRWAPLPPRAPAGLTHAERAEWRQDWYDRVYFEWKASVIAAIAADLDGAARLFRDLVPEQERPDLDDYRPRARAASSRPRRSRLIPGAGKKRKPDKTDFAAAALAERMSVRQVAEVLKLTRMTAWRRIQNGRTGHADLLLKMRTVSRGGPIEMPSSSALPAGKLREPTLSQVTPTMGVTPTVVGQSPTVGGGQ